MLCVDMGMHEYCQYLQFLFEVHFWEFIKDNFVIFGYILAEIYFMFGGLRNFLLMTPIWISFGNSLFLSSVVNV